MHQPSIKERRGKEAPGPFASSIQGPSTVWSGVESTGARRDQCELGSCRKIWISARDVSSAECWVLRLFPLWTRRSEELICAMAITWGSSLLTDWWYQCTLSTWEGQRFCHQSSTDKASRQTLSSNLIL